MRAIYYHATMTGERRDAHDGNMPEFIGNAHSIAAGAPVTMFEIDIDMRRLHCDEKMSLPAQTFTLRRPLAKSHANVIAIIDRGLRAPEA